MKKILILCMMAVIFSGCTQSANVEHIEAEPELVENSQEEQISFFDLLDEHELILNGGSFVCANVKSWITSEEVDSFFMDHSYTNSDYIDNFFSDERFQEALDGGSLRQLCVDGDSLDAIYFSIVKVQDNNYRDASNVIGVYSLRNNYSGFSSGEIDVDLHGAPGMCSITGRIASTLIADCSTREDNTDYLRQYGLNMRTEEVTEFHNCKRTYNRQDGTWVLECETESNFY